MEHNSAEYLHSVIEALSLSFADTLWYNADPSKIQVPVSGLLSKEYAAKRRSLIRQDRLVKYYTVERPVSDQPEYEDLEVAYGSWSLMRIYPRGVFSKKRSWPIHFLEEFLLRAISKLTTTTTTPTLFIKAWIERGEVSTRK